MFFLTRRHEDRLAAYAFDKKTWRQFFLTRRQEDRLAAYAFDKKT